uniref:protein LAZY 1-like n=1 Tax=Erigeron canadensis TaxID=72917 RepID=UPI001CB9CC43|nr:protein LAZY 1-like [Erigeron canadensis]
MKLLDWMHRKFRNGEPLKEISTGNPCICLMGQPSLDDFEYYPKSNYHAKPSNKSRETQLRKSFACLEGVRAEEDHTEDESSAALSELFHGFLAIGTLGMDPVTSDPGTPTFSTSVEYIMEKETEATENELQFINDELEKVLTGEGKEDDSSARNSYVSNGRSSHGSTITLSGKPLEAADSENGSVACPLQGYLFGSAVGLPETTTGKKEHRTSLGELFQKTKLADENTGNKCNKLEKQKDKETEKSAVHLMKKILKGRKASGGTGSMDTASADKKLNKILHMFHRKVHPERTTKSQNQSKNMMNATSVNEEVYKKGNQMMSGEDITIIPERDMSKKIATYKKSNICGANDSNENRECWIKSDADYLVLEL